MSLNYMNNSAHRHIFELIRGKRVLGLRNKRVLDVGCGNGDVAGFLSATGCIVTGIERDRFKASKAKNACETVIIADLEKEGLCSTEKFDVVLLADILEHLRNPAEILVDAGKRLKKGGHLVISVPNVANWKIRLKLLAGGFDYTSQGILDKSHIHFYTKKTIKELLEKSGFEITEWKFVPSFPFPFFKPFLSKLSRGLFSYQFVFTAVKR